MKFLFSDYHDETKGADWERGAYCPKCGTYNDVMFEHSQAKSCIRCSIRMIRTGNSFYCSGTFTPIEITVPIIPYGNDGMVIGEATERYLGLDDMDIYIKKFDEYATIYRCYINRNNKIVQIWANVFKSKDKLLVKRVTSKNPDLDPEDESFARCLRPRHCSIDGITLDEVMDVVFS